MEKPVGHGWAELLGREEPVTDRVSKIQSSYVRQDSLQVADDSDSQDGRNALLSQEIV